MDILREIKRHTLKISTGQGNFTVERICPRDSGGKRMNSKCSKEKRSDRTVVGVNSTPERMSRESGASERCMGKEEGSKR